MNLMKFFAHNTRLLCVMRTKDPAVICRCRFTNLRANNLQSLLNFFVFSLSLCFVCCCIVYVCIHVYNGRTHTHTKLYRRGRFRENSVYNCNYANAILYLRQSSAAQCMRILFLFLFCWSTSFCFMESSFFSMSTRPTMKLQFIKLHLLK